MASVPEFAFPSFPYFLPSHFLTWVAILPISFGGKGPHLRGWQVAQPSSTVSWLRFSGIFLSCNVIARRSVHSPRYHLIITFIISLQTWRSGQVDINYESWQELKAFLATVKMSPCTATGRLSVPPSFPHCLPFHSRWCVVRSYRRHL